MKVITVATQYSGYMLVLEESAKKLGYDLIILGMKMKWKGFGWRVKLVLDYIKNLPNDEVFLMVDAYDVILLRPPKDALEEFNKLNSKFICGSFKKCGGIIGKIIEDEFGKLDYIPDNCISDSICAGTWMTSAKYCLDMWSKYIITDDFDDQRLLINIYNNKPGSIYPDFNCNIFCTIFPNIITKKINYDEKLEFKLGHLYYGRTDTYPILLHGMANTNMTDIIKKLGYKNYKDLTPSTYHINKIFYHIKFAFKHSRTLKFIVFAILVMLSTILIKIFLN